MISKKGLELQLPGAPLDMHIPNVGYTVNKKYFGTVQQISYKDDLKG